MFYINCLDTELSLLVIFNIFAAISSFMFNSLTLIWVLGEMGGGANFTPPPQLVFP